MTVKNMTLNQIEQAGLAALSRALGPVGLVRFLQLFESGAGDYTADRTAWLDEQAVDEIARRIRERREHA